MTSTILLLGGDARQTTLCSLLRDAGLPAAQLDAAQDSTAVTAAVAQCRALILPYPVSRDGKTLIGTPHNLPLDPLFSALQPGQSVCGGGFSLQHKALFASRGVRVLDTADSETFLQTNAHLTAQGALRLLLEGSDDLLQNSRILITGYGRIGQALANALTALHCDVYVAARSETQRTRAALSGCKVLDTAALSPTLHLFDIIVNTVPHRLFSGEDISHFKDGARYLELASAPFGADPNAFSAGWQSGAALPGKFTPHGAAAALYAQILPFLKEGDPECPKPSAMA